MAERVKWSRIKQRVSSVLKENKKQSIIDDVRSGLFTLPQIAKKQNVNYHKVYRLAKLVGTKQDLHADIIHKATQEVVALHVADNQHDAVVVSENTQIVLAMMREHSQSVMRARGVAALLMDDLEAAIRNRAEIEADIEIECSKDSEDEERKSGMSRRTRMLRAVSLQTNTKILNDLSSALKILILLEREMFGIGQGDDGNGKQSLEEYVLSLPGESVRVVEP